MYLISVLIVNAIRKVEPVVLFVDHLHCVTQKMC